jgi:hypothetical protein
MAFPSLFILFTYLNNGGFLMQSSSSTYIHTNFIITSIIFLSKFESTCANELDLSMHKALFETLFSIPFPEGSLIHLRSKIYHLTYHLAVAHFFIFWRFSSKFYSFNSTSLVVFCYVL